MFVRSCDILLAMDNQKRNEIILNQAVEFLQYLGVTPTEAFVEDAEEDQVLVTINVENPAGLIGFKGKSLAAFQLLLALMVKNKLGEPLKIVVDVNGYREAQKERLVKQMNEVVAKVIETGEDYHLSPMSPFERRMVHMLVEGQPEIKTESEGEGELRHVVVKKQV